MPLSRFLLKLMQDRNILLIRKGDDGEVVNSFTEWSIACCDVPFKAGGTVKELAKRDFPDEHGEDTFIPKKLVFEAYDAEFEMAYAGQELASNPFNLSLAFAQIDSFKKWLSGNDEEEGSGAELFIYSPYTTMGRKCYLKEISDEEKEYKSMRKQIQEKLIKFATRIPVFMYLTDYRERTLKDVITQLEPGLFKKVTGLDVPDFEMLCTLGVFNASLMNDAIFKFKRYEDSSLSYTGIDRHEGMDVGGWDTVLKKAEYDQLFYNQQATMEAPAVEQPDEIEDVIIPIKKPEPVAPKPKTTYVTGQYGVKPTASMVAEKPAPYGAGIQKPVAKPASKPEEKADEVQVDYSRVVIGAKVIHKAFGEGTIVSIDKKMSKIDVKFAAGQKSFIIEKGNSFNAFVRGFLRFE